MRSLLKLLGLETSWCTDWLQARAVQERADRQSHVARSAVVLDLALNAVRVNGGQLFDVLP
jgi:hypothetical protein